MQRILAFVGIFLAMFSFGSAQPLPVGAPAPAVTALTDEGTPLNLADLYRDFRYTLVYFYPKADTPGCTAQGCSLRDAYEELARRGVAIVGVSTDSVEEQAKFKAKHRLPFTLLADTEKAVVEAFGVSTTLGFASRQAYLVEGGKVVYADHKGSTKQQAQDILTFLGPEKVSE
jgi:thioredoxin-dependent peroxiredoxin